MNLLPFDSGFRSFGRPFGFRRLPSQAGGGASYNSGPKTTAVGGSNGNYGSGSALVELL